MPERKKVFKVDEAQIKRLQAAVRKAGGKAIVLIHPFFDEKLPDHERSIGKSYTQAVDIILSNKKTPVILMEQHFARRVTRERLAAKGQKSILVLPIGTNSGAPLISIQGLAEEIDEERKTLIELLEKVGTKTVLMGGMFANELHSGKSHPVMREEIKWQNAVKTPEYFAQDALYLEYPLIRYCAGETYKYLVESGKFKVRWMGAAVRPRPDARIQGRIIRKRPYTNPRKRTAYP